jgi:hypothetical protein
MACNSNGNLLEVMVMLFGLFLFTSLRFVRLFTLSVFTLLIVT